MTDHELTEEEREAMRKLEAPRPPADFAERVLARVDREEAGERRRRVGIAGGIALAASVALALIVPWATGPASSGRVVAERRETIALGSRATAVGEAGSEVSWRIEASGAARVEQPRGNVFYRVERGGAFEVSTPAGTITVLGTCFRVEVSEMKPRDAALSGAVAGAAVAVAAMVTVYEGRVLTANAQGSSELVAGEAASMSPGVAPRQAKAALSSAGGAVADGDAAIAGSASALTKRLPEAQPTTIEGYAKETERLRGRITVLEGQLAQFQTEARKGKTFDLTPAELVEMANNCQLRWDTPGFDKPTTVDDKDAAKVGLGKEERGLVNEAFKAEQERVVGEIRKLYAETTGDETTGSLSVSAMMSEIEDKTPRELIQRTFQKLARERAGLEQAPAEGAPAPTIERLYRLLTTAGDSAENAIAEKIGPEKAHALRTHDGGFGSRHRSSFGCPGEK